MDQERAEVLALVLEGELLSESVVFVIHVGNDVVAAFFFI